MSEKKFLKHIEEIVSTKFEMLQIITGDRTYTFDTFGNYEASLDLLGLRLRLEYQEDGIVYDDVIKIPEIEEIKIYNIVS